VILHLYSQMRSKSTSQMMLKRKCLPQ